MASSSYSRHSSTISNSGGGPAPYISTHAVVMTPTPDDKDDQSSCNRRPARSKQKVQNGTLEKSSSSGRFLQITSYNQNVASIADDERRLFSPIAFVVFCIVTSGFPQKKHYRGRKLSCKGKPQIVAPFSINASLMIPSRHKPFAPFSLSSHSFGLSCIQKPPHIGQLHNYLHAIHGLTNTFHSRTRRKLPSSSA